MKGVYYFCSDICSHMSYIWNVEELRNAAFASSFREFGVGLWSSWLVQQREDLVKLQHRATRIFRRKVFQGKSFITRVYSCGISKMRKKIILTRIMIDCIHEMSNLVIASGLSPLLVKVHLLLFALRIFHSFVFAAHGQP